MNLKHSSIKRNISILWKILKDTIKDSIGEDILRKIENIKILSQSSRNKNENHREKLIKLIQNLTITELVPIARAFCQFLNLINTSEQYYCISYYENNINSFEELNKILFKIKDYVEIDENIVFSSLNTLSIELVLTAHPTEIIRHTLIHVFININNCLKKLDCSNISIYEYKQIIFRLKQLIMQYWNTNEIRKNRPTPLDEARWSFSVIEHSLWESVPFYLRKLNEKLERILNYKLPENTIPITFSSWIGGDRDGNPNVTAKITRKILLLNRLQAADLFIRDIQTLISELSMNKCTLEFRKIIGCSIEEQEPYRNLLKNIRNQLINTKLWINAQLYGEDFTSFKGILKTNDQLWDPLFACYCSLKTCGMQTIANGKLLDTLQRIKCFGVQLVSIDVRQESSRHTEALSEITCYLGLGDYAHWSEIHKQNFLIQKLKSCKPLLQKYKTLSKRTIEVIETFKVIAESIKGSITAYIISMTHEPSDILIVYLFLKEVRCTYNIYITPLFETLDDLNHSDKIIEELLNISLYREIIQGKQMIMIGYSDSAKDAGIMSASWAQYRAQDALIKICKNFDIDLILFHGRGGSIGRGGTPMYEALLSQPPGSLKGGLRVTEQGEVIRFKYGIPEIAINNLALYTGAVLKANIFPPPEPHKEWKEIIKNLSKISCKYYRNYVKYNSDFISYFRSATPEIELEKLPIGSRPEKRCSENNGIENLRAISWIFSWTQNRLMLPEWLGSGAALQKIVQSKKIDQLKIMFRKWPFFHTHICMLKIVFSKSDLLLSEYYEKRLVQENLWFIGKKLRKRLIKDYKIISEISNSYKSMKNESIISELINFRNVYIDPLNILQAELLYRFRQNNVKDERIEKALVLTMAGISAGIRNTG